MNSENAICIKKKFLVLNQVSLGGSLSCRVLLQLAAAHLSESLWYALEDLLLAGSGVFNWDWS